MRLVAACLGVALLAGCKSDPKITGVRIRVDFPVGAVDQLRFSLTENGEDHDSELRPQTAAGPLASPQDLVIYLPDRWADGTAVCTVMGLAKGVPVAFAVPQLLDIEPRKIVNCKVSLAERLPDGGTPPATDDAGVPVDVAVPMSDGPAADGALPRDLLPGVDVPAPDVAPPPDGALPADAPLTPDAPADTAAPPVDLAPPADSAIVTGCAGGATRAAFVNPAMYPSVASCGVPMTYNAALGTGSAACAPNWHWCKAEEVGSLGSTHPGTVAGSTCSWVDGTQAVCNDKRTAYPRAGCTGGGGVMQSIGGPPSASLPCLGTDLNCMEPWKLALAFDRWAITSVTRMGAGCLENLASLCTSMSGGASCWITCCKN
jgi:hypothetical protein